MEPKKIVPKKSPKKIVPKKKPVTTKKKKGLTVEKDPEDSNSNEIDEIKYSEKLKKLLGNIKSTLTTDSDVRVRFAWKN